MTTGVDPEEVRQHLEAKLLVDTVRISRPTGTPVLDPLTGLVGPTPAQVIYEGRGAVLSGHGQVAAEGIVGRQWLDDTVSWYRLLTPLAAPVPDRYDQVAVTAAASATAATAGRTWQVLDPSEASTVEVVRVTRLDEITPP
ncbi:MULTISPECIES: DUF6093 family protein [unclassified Streptomyces]|uniref:DUF6093 family protein n=1 Tax=unclassified Streptomyces TaxID=2593676 RepID=UPI0022B07221|nr:MULTISPECIES: DUF6093 family protein [unclassified Streptomyces]MCZ4098297.1 DUF6093 family protein [Streptomyces sp. H39-C1]MDF9813020.1 hypothetical protein [Streptomyces sp. SPB162]